MCDYEGYEFGGGYIDGYLWDLDSCDEPGGGLTHGGEWACPKCNTERYLLDRAEDATDGSCGRSMATPWCGATIWEAAVGMAKKHNPDVAAKVLASVPPFIATHGPDRQAVYDGRASWENTIDRQWPWPIATPERNRP